MTLFHAATTARAPGFSLGIVGVFWGGLAGSIPDIKAIAGASDSDFGLIIMISAVGSIAAMYVAPRLVGWLGRASLPVIGGGASLAILLPILGTDVWRLSVVFLFTGATIGLMDIAGNIRTSNIESKHGIGLMNFVHAMFSFGFGTAALAVAHMREAGMGPDQILPLLALTLIVLSLCTIETREKFGDASRDEPTETRNLSGYWTVSLLAALVLFSALVGENSAEAWSALHIERTLGAEIGHGSFGPAVLGFGMGIVRLLGQVVTDRIGERKIIILSACLGCLGAVITAIAPTVGIVLFGVLVIAIGMAVMVPSANTVLGRRVPSNLRGLALSRMWMFGMTGFFVGPAIMGFMSELFGLRISYAVIALVIALAIPATIALGRIPRVSDREQM